METIGARALLCPSTIALCPPRHLLAAATAARGGNKSGGGGSWIDIIRLWREEGEKDAGRSLKRVATIRECDGAFHRLAWSPGEASSEYRLGLLAGGLDCGAVRIWDPSRLLYEPEAKAKLSGGRRVSWSEKDGSSSSASLNFIMHGLNGMPKPLTVVDKKAAVKSKDLVEQIAARMREKLNPLIKDHVAKQKSSNLDLQHDTKGDSKDWEFIPSEETVSKPPDPSTDWNVLILDPLIKDHVAKQRYSKLDLQHDAKGDSKDWEFIPSEEIVSKLPDPSTDEIWNALILKLDKLTGPVKGLAFNNQYPNMLASAAYSETLNIHYVDYPSELATRGSKKMETQMMYLEWHPFFPAILASTCDIGATKLWDLRENSWKVTYKQDEDRECICTEVHWNPSDPWMLAVASKDSFPMKIWDTRHSRGVLFDFGTGKGVASFSWSPCGQIITTDVDGASDCWKLDNKWVPCSWSMSASGVCEARWCQSESTVAAVSTENLMLYKLPVDGCSWPSWAEKNGKDSPVKGVLV